MAASPRATTPYLAWLSMRSGGWVMPRERASLAWAAWSLWPASTLSAKQAALGSVKGATAMRCAGPPFAPRLQRPEAGARLGAPVVNPGTYLGWGGPGQGLLDVMGHLGQHVLLAGAA